MTDPFTLIGTVAIVAGMLAWYLRCFWRFHDPAPNGRCRRCGLKITPALASNRPQTNDRPPDGPVHTPRTCDCPIVFPEIPELTGQVHRIDCPRRHAPFAMQGEQNP
jgi:hypothetical protein